MKKFSILFTMALICLPASVQASLESEPALQTLETTAECKSAFGNMFCSGDYACREVANAEATAKNCKVDIKKVGVVAQPDYITNGMTYRSYNCQIEEKMDCQQ